MSLSELLERVKSAIHASQVFVGRYEAEHMSNAALDAYTENEQVIALLEAKIAEDKMDA
jgi:hypothetical protein